MIGIRPRVAARGRRTGQPGPSSRSASRQVSRAAPIHSRAGADEGPVRHRDRRDPFGGQHELVAAARWRRQNSTPEAASSGEVQTESGPAWGAGSAHDRRATALTVAPRRSRQAGSQHSRGRDEQPGGRRGAGPADRRRRVGAAAGVIRTRPGRPLLRWPGRAAPPSSADDGRLGGGQADQLRGEAPRARSRAWSWRRRSAPAATTVAVSRAARTAAGRPRNTNSTWA